MLLVNSYSVIDMARKRVVIKYSSVLREQKR